MNKKIKKYISGGMAVAFLLTTLPLQTMAATISDENITKEWETESSINEGSVMGNTLENNDTLEDDDVITENILEDDDVITENVLENDNVIIEDPLENNDAFIENIQEDAAKATGLAIEAAVKPELAKMSDNIVVGGKTKIKVKNVSKRDKITYQSAKKNIATVSKKGIVKGLKSGTAEITVSIKKKLRTTKLTYKVTVKKPGLSKRRLSLTLGRTAKLSVKNKPKKAQYTWKSDNPRIATINKTGKVTAKSKGTAKIKVRVKTAKKIYNLSCKVTVKPSSGIQNNISQTYTVTFKLRNPNEQDPPDQHIEDGRYASQPDISDRYGYEFAGWFLNKDENDLFNTFLFEFTPITSDITLYAIWVETAEKYSYEVIPFMPPFNSYFYIKTDNPDPESFQFVDEGTRYADEGNVGKVTPSKNIYADVKYEDSETKRVNGGYIAKGSATDGGELRLQRRVVTKRYPVYDETTGKITMENEYGYENTEVTVQTAELKDVVDYLISTYGDSSKPYLDNLSGIERGFTSECLYSGAHVLGEQKKSTTKPYYGLSTSPHVDQTFYIQSPYFRSGNQSMLVSSLYPMIYDSIGFPSVMWTIAKELDSTATVKWSTSAHNLINVTYNGETRTYGGQGRGRGQGINADQIKYWYSFDGSEADAYMKCNLKDVSEMILEYGEMEVPEEPTDQPKLTWASVRQTVGKEGGYVKLTLLTSIFGGSKDGYTFMYDDGGTTEGPAGWGGIGSFTNVWYDGRYFNKWEYFYPGVRFEDTVQESPSIVIKDVSIKLPDDGKTYYYNGYSLMNSNVQYNMETGVWSGLMEYRYNEKSQTWKADILNKIKYKEGKKLKSIEDQNFIDACTITMDEAFAMNLDVNTDKEPENYYIYDQVTSPGTYHSAGY